MKLTMLLALALALVGCGGGGDGGSADLAPGPDLQLYSICGHPGDTGNSLGVGKFCMTLSDCSSNAKATLCSTLGSSDSYFCTFVCSGPTDTSCGDNATCQCQGGQCGCYPSSCM
jgi:hypothetical protein